MSKRGPKPLMSHEEKVEALKNFEIFDDLNKVKKESHPVWQDVCNFINAKYAFPDSKKMTIRNIQNYVAQNRNGVLFDLQVGNVTQESYFSEQKEMKNLDEEKELLTLQNNVMYKHIIKEVSTFPLNIFHWETEAIDFAAVNSTKNTDYIFVRVGNFCKNFCYQDGTTSKFIYLYIFGASICNKFIPICHLSTDENSTTIFKRFFNEIVRNDAPIPNKLIVDYNYNVYEAANSAYNVNVSLEKYLTQCFLYLRGNETKTLPKCLIMTDIKFLIGTVLNWNCIHNISTNSIKYFYVYCIVLLSHQNRLEDFEDILLKVFVISLSEFQGQSTHDFFEDIMSKVKELKIDEIYDQNNIKIIEEEFISVTDSYTYSKINYEEECIEILNYIVEIVIRAKQFTLTENTEWQRNAYYSEQICQNLIKCCVEFVMWTKVMNISETKHSLSVNELVHYYKNDFERFLINPQPSLYTYLVKNIEYSSKSLEIIKNNIQTFNQTAAKRNNKLEHLYHTENWMGYNIVDLDDVSNNSLECSSDDDASSDNSEICSDDGDEENYSSGSGPDFDAQDITSIIESAWQNVSIKDSPRISLDVEDHTLKSDLDNMTTNIKSNCKQEVKIRGTYLKACPEIDLLNQKPSSKLKNRKIIKNYNLLKPRSVGKKKLFVTTSSFFDSVLEVLVSSYFNIQKLQDSINEFSEKLSNTKMIFLNLFKEYIRTFNFTKLYAERIKLIENVCQSTNNKLTWNKSIGEFFKYIMYPNIFIKMECLDCKLSNYQYCNLVEVSFEELVSENLSVIIHNCLLAKRNCCNICSNTDIICQYSISDLFCINVEKEAKIVNLDQLVPVLTFSTGKFILTGVIAYEEPIASNVLRHYVAYVRSLKGIWNKYNDINIEFSKPEKVKNNLGIKVALLFYIKYESIEEKNQCSVVVHEVDVCEDISNNNSNLLPDCNLEINKIILQKKVEEETYIESETETHIHDISPSNDFQYQDSLMNFDDMIGNEVVVEFVETSIQDVSSSNNLLYEDSSNLDKMIENEEKPECSSVDASLNNSYTETCWSNNESTSSVESSFNVHAFLSYHPWRHLIQNGSKLPPIKLPTQDVKLINTCPIDCIAELLTAAHCFEGSVNYLIFEIGLSKNKKNEIFEIIWEYCMNKSRNIYYTKRMDYCISKPKLYTQTIKTDYLLIDCQDNVIRLFESIMSGELLHSIEKTITCTCNYVNKKKYSIQHINTDLRMEDSLIFELENYLQTYFSKKIKKCYQCQKDARLTYKINSYLCIELETNFIIHKDMQARLNSIPTRLNLCKEEYNLLGVIAFDLPIHENGLLHYYVFIRLPNTEWEERNNLTNIIKRHSKRSTITIKPAILFYARKNVYKRSYDKYL